MKNKIFKSVLSVIAVLVLVLTMSSGVLAADAGFDITVKKPGSIYSDTDLFENFKGMMPGDTRQQTVTVKNSTGKYDYMKVYLRAVPADTDGNPISEKVMAELTADTRRGDKTELSYMLDFLSVMKLKVTNGSKVLFNDSAEKTSSLSENVYLGTVRKGEALELEAELSMPLETGNEYMDRIGEIIWVFTAEAFNENVLTVRKVWKNDGGEHPDKIEVKLLKDGKPEKTAELNEENQWSFAFDKLSEENKWTVEEAVPEGYEAEYIPEGDVVTIVNKKTDSGEVTPVLPAKELTVIKKWDSEKHPDSVKITLYNGSTAVSTVELNKDNSWTYKWENLDGSGKWQVLETSVPEGFAPTYSKDGNVITVTNSESLIHTGQNITGIVIFASAGLIMTAAGLIILLRKKKHEQV